MNSEVRNRKSQVRGALALCALLLTLPAAAQPTNAPAQSGGHADFSAFQIITRKNIFNQNRTGFYINSRPRQQAVRVDTFSLVGTISYPKGTFAFFDGSSSDYRKVLEPSEQIAGYTVKEISPKAVTLEANGKMIEMKVGAQMRREENRQWELRTEPEWTPPPTESASSNSATPASTRADSDLESNEVLKRLMQQREKE